MFEQAYRYKFAGPADLRDAVDTLLLSIVAAQGLFGEARVSMDLAFAIDETISVILIDASTDVGQDVNAIFTSFITREFGPGVFHVKRVTGLSEVSR